MIGGAVAGLPDFLFGLFAGAMIGVVEGRRQDSAEASVRRPLPGRGELLEHVIGVTADDRQARYSSECLKNWPGI